jgi:hypothetical protein
MKEILLGLAGFTHIIGIGFKYHYHKRSHEYLPNGQLNPPLSSHPASINYTIFKRDVSDFRAIQDLMNYMGHNPIKIVCFRNNTGLLSYGKIPLICINDLYDWQDGKDLDSK